MSTSVLPDTLRSKLLAMAQQADIYPFLSLVEEYLATDPADDQIRACAMGAAIQKGLYSIAIDLAEQSPQSAQGEELRGAAQKLTGLPSDRLLPSVTNDCFARNMAALRGRETWGPPLAQAIEKHWKTIFTGLSFHRANDGNILIRGFRSDGRWMWLPAALDYANRIEQLADEKWKGAFPPPFLVDGIGLGWFIPRLFQATTHTFLNYSPAIFVVEPNLTAMAAVLHIHDYSTILSDERVYFFTGASAWENWAEHMQREDALALPRQIIRLPQWRAGEATSPGDEMIKRVQAHRDHLFAESDREARQIYAGRDVEYWADRFASADSKNPLRILAYTSRYTTFLQHSTRDMLAALERAGMETRVLIEDRDHHTVPPLAHMRATAEFEPDLILVLDHHRHEYPNRFLENIPFVCWIQDELPNLFGPQIGSRLGPLDFTIGFGIGKYVTKCGYPAEQFMPCKVPVNLEKFARTTDETLDEAIACDVAYVSHQSETAADLHARVRGIVSHVGIRRLMDGFYEETRPLMTGSRFNAGWDLYKLLADVEQKTNIFCDDPADREQLMNVYIRPLADRHLRHATLEWAANWADQTGRKLCIYGNGWEKHPRFAPYARGPAQHGRHLGQIARHAKINLHTGLNSALHQRVLETAGAGGFMMVRYYPFDFYGPEKAALWKYVKTNGIEQATKIPLNQLPAEFVQSLKRLTARTNREVPEYQDITEEMLLREKYESPGKQYDYANLAFPNFEKITFDGPEQFIERAEWFLANEDARQKITNQMRSAINELFTYDALVPRLINFLTGALHANRTPHASERLEPTIHAMNGA